MSVRWVNRQMSGLVPPTAGCLRLRNDRVWGVTKHHSASAPPKTPYDSLALWRELQAEAMSGNNVNHVRYCDIEYNVGFDDFGQLLIGRDNQWVGAHAKSTNDLANRMTFGIVYLGTGNPSPLAMDAYHAYLYVASYSIGHAAITLGHKDWERWGGINTNCPGPFLEASRP